MKLAEMLKTLFEGMEVEPSMSIKDVYNRVGEGQSVITEDMLAVHFPCNGQTSCLSQWPDSEGYTLICSHSGIVEVINDDGEIHISGYLSEKVVVKFLAEFMLILDKMRFDAVDPIKAREQFRELWESYACRIIPDPADLRKALIEKYEQNRTNTEGMGPS